MKFYEINQEMQNCLVTDENGEISEDSFNRLEELQMQEDEKLENLGVWYKTLMAESKAIKEERDSLYERQKAKEKKAEGIKAFLDYYLHSKGKSKFETAKLVLTFRKSTALEILNEDKVPEQFWKIKKEISKSDIKDAIKNGASFDFATIVEKENIQIK